MTVTDRTAPTPRSCSFGEREAEWWCSTHDRRATDCGVSLNLVIATHAVMRHYGYTDEQISAAEAMTCESAGCRYIDGCEWDCTDEAGKSRHPISDELAQTAEILRVAFASVGVSVDD